MKKAFLTAWLMCMMLFVTASYIAAAPLWETDTEEMIAQGVTLRRIDRFYQNTWDRIRVLYVDLTNDNLSLRVLTADGGISQRETTLSMAERAGAIAAVNGDFFNMTAPPTNMLGMLVQKGELHSTPSSDAGLANLAFSEDGSVLMDYFSFSGKVTAPEGYYSSLFAINKVPVTTGGVTMLTPAWGEMTTGVLKGIPMTELVVEDNIVTEIRIGMEPAPIPENGYVLVTNGAINGFLQDAFQIGDAVELETELSPELGKIREATGGGTLLVQNGKLATFTHDVAGYAQRTAIGIDKKGTTLMLVTVDGRLAECEGMNQTELARVLMELGCDTAINLDGGGSTTMVARERFSGKLAVQNTLTGSMRTVSTAVGIFEAAPKNTSVSGIALRASAEAVFCGEPIDIEYAVYNKYGNNIDVSPAKVQIKTDRAAKITGTKIVPSEGGTYTVTVTCGNARQTVQFESVKDFTDIYLSSQSRKISVGNYYNFTLRGTDAFGNSVNIPASAVKWSIDSDAFTVQNGKVTAKAAGSAFLCAEFDGMKAYAAIATDGETLYNKPVDVGAQHQSYGEGNGYALYLSGAGYESNNLLYRLLNAQRNGFLASQKQAYRLGAYTGETENIAAITGFTKQSINNNLLLTVNNLKGGIKNTDASQWPLLISAVENATEKSIVILMPNSVYSLEENEKIVFDALLAEATEKGKAVYVVYEGSETDYAMEKGVTYLVCGAMKNAHTKTFFNDRERFACIKLTLTLSGVRFSYVY